MLYYVRRFPEAGSEEQQGEALARLVANAGGLTIHAVRVGGNAGLYIDVPEAVTALVELRVLPGLVGMEGCLERRKAWAQRPEWTLHALLAPRSGALPLDIALLDGCASACLTLRWTRAGVAGHLYASADDTALLDRVAERGWAARVAPDGVRGRLLASLHRPRRTALRPLLAAQPLANTPSHVVASGPTDSPPPDEPAAPACIAPPGATGLPLGMDEQGRTVALAFRPQLLAVTADEGDQATLSVLLYQRALGIGAGFVAIVPRAAARALRHTQGAERLRALDGGDPYGSASIPWRSLAPAALDAALASAGVGGGAHAPQGSSFAKLLAGQGSDHLATDALRWLTAPPGDDLRGVVEAGGGVVLADEGGVTGQLLAALLLHLLAADPPLRRPVVLLRPAHLDVPLELAAQALQVAFGSTAAHSTLVRVAQGWRLTSGGGWGCQLQADLGHLAPAPDPAAHAALLQGLMQPEERAQTPLIETSVPETASWWDALAEGREAAGSTPVAPSPEMTSPPPSEAFLWGTLSDELDDMLRNSSAFAGRDADPPAPAPELIVPVARAATPPQQRLTGRHKRRRAVWRPGLASRHPMPIEPAPTSDEPMAVTHTAKAPSIAKREHVPLDEFQTIAPTDMRAPVERHPPAPHGTLVVGGRREGTSAPPIDLSPIAAQLLRGWREGLRLPALVAQAAPSYPHAPPQALRAAIRSLVEQAAPATPPQPKSVQGLNTASDTPCASTSPLVPETVVDAPLAHGGGPEEYLSPSEAARALGVTNKTIQRWSDDGKIAVTRNDANHRRIPRSEVERLRAALEP